MSTGPEFDRAYGAKLAQEDAAYGRTVPPKTAETAKKPQKAQPVRTYAYDCYLCGQHWQAPRYDWAHDCRPVALRT